jgi:hypothetical protein
MTYKTHRELVFDHILANQGATIRSVQEAFGWRNAEADDSTYIFTSKVRKLIRDLVETSQVRIAADAGLYAVNRTYTPPPKLVPGTNRAVDPPQHTPPQTPEQAVDKILSTLNIQTAAILRHKLNEMFQ